MNNLNLDYIAACVSQKIAEGDLKAKDLENLATKTLGVLQEQGVYAMMLFLFSRTSSSEGKIAQQLINYLDAARRYLENPITSNSSNDCPIDTQDNSDGQPNRDEVLQSFARLSSDINRLLLARDLFEQILTYVRYHAKAKS